jgi:hypothetical protein
MGDMGVLAGEEMLPPSVAVAKVTGLVFSSAAVEEDSAEGGLSVEDVLVPFPFFAEPATGRFALPFPLPFPFSSYSSSSLNIVVANPLLGA